MSRPVLGLRFLRFWPVRTGMGRFMSGLGFWPVCGLVGAGSSLIWGGFIPAPDRPRPDPSLFAHMLAVKPLVRHTGRREIKKTSGSTQTPVTYDPYYYTA